jgi:antitoxin YefM
MDVLKFSDAKANLKRVMDRVVDDHAPMVVTRKGGESMVMISLADWPSVDETLHLISTSANAEALRSAIDALGRDKKV